MTARMTPTEVIAAVSKDAWESPKAAALYIQSLGFAILPIEVMDALKELSEARAEIDKQVEAAKNETSDGSCFEKHRAAVLRKESAVIDLLALYEELK